MSNLTSVGVTNGQGSSGTGTVSTIDALMAVVALETGGNLATVATETTAVAAAAGVTSGAAVVTDANGTLQQYLRGLVKLFAAAIVGGTGSLFSKITDGTNTAAVKPASTAALATDPAVVVTLSPNGINANGIAVPGSSAPTINAKYYYQTIAASTGPTTLAVNGAGATGDTIIGILVIPSATTIGAITLTDGSTGITVYAGGTYNADLKPFPIDLGGIASKTGAWKITTLAGASVIATGVF